MAYRDDWLTFNIRIHPSLEAEWVAIGIDVRAKMSQRIRKELDRCIGKGREFFFVIEGWSKDTKAATHLHFHGGAAMRETGDRQKIELAVARAAGHGLRGNTPTPRAIHTAVFQIEQAAYATYLFKAARMSDPRLKDRRLAMSQSLTSTARLFWESITREVYDWRQPISSS